MVTRNILITGGTGFIASHLAPRLAADGHQLKLAQRLTAGKPISGDWPRVFVGDLNATTDWRAAIERCDTVIHLAGQSSSGPDGACEIANNLGTLGLVKQCAEGGVRYVIFVSSVMAMADSSSDVVMTDHTPTSTTSDYGISKLRAERHVEQFGRSCGVGVILRPPAVYGPGAKGNWNRLHQLARSGLPLPFAAVSNRRTFISVGNLVDAVATIVAAGQSAASGTHVVSDDEALSTPAVLRLLRQGMGLPPRLFSAPETLISLPLRLGGGSNALRSLLGNLEVDCHGFRQRYGWSPPKGALQEISSYGASGG